MLVAAQVDVGRMNCAGAGCPERAGCRRYVTRIVGPARAEWTKQFGRWGSFDVERAHFGDCRSFVHQARPSA